MIRSKSAPRAAAGSWLPAGRSRRRSSTVSPGATATRYHTAHLVPRRAGLTVAAPDTTWSLIPSLGYGVSAATPYRRCVLVAFSQNSSAGSVPSGPGAASSSSSPRTEWAMPTLAGPVAASSGLAASGCHAQVLRNQTVGRTLEYLVLGSGVRDLYRHQQVGRVSLGVAHLDDPVPIVLEDAGVEQLVLGIVPATPAVLGHQVRVRESGLRVVVTPPVPGVARYRIEVPPVLFDVLTVVALGPGQAERPLLEDRVAPVPQRESQTQPLLAVAEPGQPVLTPPVGPRPGVVVRQVAPRPAVRAVVLAYRSPLALAEVRPPQVPVRGWPARVRQSPALRARHVRHQ